MLILLIGFSSYSKELDQTSEFDTLQFQCIQKIVNHSYTKKNYPNLIKDQSKELYFSFLSEIDRFCSCQSKHFKIEEREKKKDFFKWSFKDKKIALEKEDQCMAENFSPHAIHTFYAISLSSRLRKYISLRIKHRIPSSSHFLAHENSVMEKFSCIEEKIIKKCSKVKSLRTTYKCIESMTNGHSNFNQLENECPRLQQDYRIADSKQLI